MAQIRNCFVVAILAGLLVAGYPTSAYSIANGDPVSDGQFGDSFPWMVAIVHKVTGGTCGGVVIAPRWIVTAAHCTGRNKFVVVGSPDITQGQRVEIERAIRHPQFDKETLQNDVGLLFLSEPVFVRTAPLASFAEASELLREGAVAVIAGWGRTAYRRPPPARLVAASTRLNSLSVFGTRINYEDLTTGPCGNDSGGPLLILKQDELPLLVGVISATAGNLCATGGGTAEATYLALAQGFVEQQMERFDPEEVSSNAP